MTVDPYNAEMARRFALAKTPDERKAHAEKLEAEAAQLRRHDRKNYAKFLESIAEIWRNPPETPYMDDYFTEHLKYSIKPKETI